MNDDKGHVEIIEISLEKIPAHSLLHYDRYEQMVDETMLFPVWSRNGVENYLQFQVLSDEQIKARGEHRYNQHDIVYDVGDQDIVLIDLTPVGNANYHETAIQSAISDMGYDFLDDLVKDLQVALQPIVAKMNPKAHWYEAHHKVLTLWKYIPIVHDYGDGIEYDFRIEFMSLFEQDMLNKIAELIEIRQKQSIFEAVEQAVKAKPHEDVSSNTDSSF